MSERQYAKQVLISSSPHIKAKESVPGIMYWVIATLMLPLSGALYFFGLDVLRLASLSVLTALLTEFVFLKSRKKALYTLFDGSAIVTGLLLVLTLPPGIKSSYVIIGSFVSIALGKQVFGGLGFNIFNPALVGRAFMQTAFPLAMTNWLPPQTMKGVDALTFATPLGGFKFSQALADIKPMIIGNIGGSLGETSAVLILAGGLFLALKKYLDWRIPTGIFFTVFVMTSALHFADPDKYAHPLFHLFAGGLMLGAVFMATDMVTSPLTERGTWIYAVSIGAIVVVIRIWGGLPEGVMYAILMTNAFVPIINRFTRPKVFGYKRKAT